MEEDGKTRVSASEEEVGKLHVKGVKILNLYCDSVIKQLQAAEPEEIPFIISINDVKKIMDITHKEGFLAIDASEDKTTELSKEIEKAKAISSKVLAFDEDLRKAK